VIGPGATAAAAARGEVVRLGRGRDQAEVVAQHALHVADRIELAYRLVGLLERALPRAMGDEHQGRLVARALLPHEDPER